MKRTIVFVIAFCSMFCMSACMTKTPIPYTNTPVTDSYIFQDTTVLTLTASYPHFEDETYAPLNAAIAQEVESWHALYAEIYEQVVEECEEDPVFAKLKRYVEATYTVTAANEEVTVLFDVRYYCGGNTEPSYSKEFTFLLAIGMVHETYTSTSRIFT